MMPTATGIRRSQTRAAAFVTAAAIMFVPANIIPVLQTDMPGQARADTIFSGILGLVDDGSYGVALIVFTASILVPLLKIVGVATLVYSVHHPPVRHRRTLTRLYGALDFIGRWSMLDVFLVSFLAGAVQFGALAHVQPRSGAIAFAAVVVLTMLATDAFDPQAIWRENRENQPSSPSA